MQVNTTAVSTPEASRMNCGYAESEGQTGQGTAARGRGLAMLSCRFLL